MKKILVVVDMQNDFIDGSLGNKQAQEIVPNVVKEIDNAISNNDYIYVTRDTHDKDYLQTLEGIKLPVKHCVKGTQGWLVNEDVYKALAKSKLDQTNFIDKFTFGSTFLASKIKERCQKEQIEQVRIVGLCTDICVVSNALILKANLKDTNVCIVSNACAGTSIENHKAAINVMRCCQCDIE